MMKFQKFFEFAYLVIAIISILEVIRSWGVQQERAYLFLMFAVVSVAMFFFRSYYRKRLEKRNKK